MKNANERNDGIETLLRRLGTLLGLFPALFRQVEKLIEQFEKLAPDFENLIAQWEPVARGWLIRQGVPHSDRDELMQETYLAFLRHLRNNPWPDNPPAFLWRILRHWLWRYWRRRRTPPLPEVPCPPGDAGVDALLDMRFFIDAYTLRRPMQAHELRVLLIVHAGDLEGAARQLIEEEGGDPGDAESVTHRKRRLASYLARFGKWLDGEFPDYFS